MTKENDWTEDLDNLSIDKLNKIKHVARDEYLNLRNLIYKLEIHIDNINEIIDRKKEVVDDNKG